MYVVYRFSAIRDEDPPYSQLTAGRYSIVCYYISRYPIALLTSTFSVTAYVLINNMKDKKQEKTESKNEIEIVAELNGKIVGTAGIDAVGGKFKISHRADFGIAILKEYCGLGIGSALTNACIECARAVGFSQLELNVVAENKAAVSLYKKLGFCEYGRNPLGFRSRISGMQELVLMRLELK